MRLEDVPISFWARGPGIEGFRIGNIPNNIANALVKLLQLEPDLMQKMYTIQIVSGNQQLNDPCFLDPGNRQLNVFGCEYSWSAEERCYLAAEAATTITGGTVVMGYVLHSTTPGEITNSATIQSSHLYYTINPARTRLGIRVDTNTPIAIIKVCDYGF